MLRKRLNRFFGGNSLALHIWSGFVYLLIVFSMLLLLVEYEFILKDVHFEETLLVPTDMITAGIFATDYFLRLYATYHRRKFIFDIFNILDLVAFTPSFFGFAQTGGLHGARFLRFLRFFRGLRLLRIFYIFRGASYKKRYFKDGRRKKRGRRR